MNAKQPTQAILDRIQAVKEDDWMGTQRSDLIEYLPFSDAKPHLKPEVTQEQWESRAAIDPMERVRDYLSFAWDKANNCRGLSAGRSLDHIRTWLWLAGFASLADTAFAEYEHYGKQQLVLASELCGFPWQEHDNGEWVNREDGPALREGRRQELIKEAQQMAGAALETA